MAIKTLGKEGIPQQFQKRFVVGELTSVREIIKKECPQFLAGKYVGYKRGEPIKIGWEDKFLILEIIAFYKYEVWQQQYDHVSLRILPAEQDQVFQLNFYVDQLSTNPDDCAP